MNYSLISQYSNPHGSFNANGDPKHYPFSFKHYSSCQGEFPAPPVLVSNNQCVALDCEMVGVGLGGQISALARVTIIDWCGTILLDEYIQPDCEVTDYRTFVSGITKDQLKQNATLSLQQCRDIVSGIIQDKIVIGHALENDLQALNIHHHPWYQIRDTAKFEPFMKVRFDDGVLWPRKLKDLAQEKLDRQIQVVDKPHSPYEDALAALDLYKVVQLKWEKTIEYKRCMILQKVEQQRLQTMQRQQLMRLEESPEHCYPTSNSIKGTQLASYRVPMPCGVMSGNTDYGNHPHLLPVQPPFVNVAGCRCCAAWKHTNYCNEGCSVSPLPYPPFSWNEPIFRYFYPEFQYYW